LDNHITHSKIPLLQTIGYFSAYFILGAVIASLGPTLLGLSQNVGVTVAQIGVLFSARSFGFLTGSFIGGSLYDKFPGHKMMAIVLLVGAGMMMILPGIEVLVILAIVIFAVGFAMGATDVGSNTMLVWVQKKKASPYLNMMYFFAGIGSFAAPLYIGRVTLSWGYIGIALLVLPVALWIFFTPSPKIPEYISKHESKISNYGLFIGFAILAFIYIGVEISYGGWIFTYFTSSNLGAQATAYTLTSIFWLSITVGRLISVPVSSRIREQILVSIYLLGAIISVAVVRFLPHQSIALWVGTIGIGLSIAAIFPTTFAFIQKKLKISGKHNGIVWAAGSLGAMTMPWIIGQEIDKIGPLAMMSTILLAYLVAFGIFQWMLFSLRKKDAKYNDE